MNNAKVPSYLSILVVQKNINGVAPADRMKNQNKTKQNKTKQNKNKNKKMIIHIFCLNVINTLTETLELLTYNPYPYTPIPYNTRTHTLDHVRFQIIATFWSKPFQYAGAYPGEA